MHQRSDVDANNCGTCGNSCNGGSCVGGKCDCSTAAGLTLCGTTCVNLQTDASNCGSCGHQCIQGVGCVDGLCQCPQGQSWTNVQSSCSGAVRQYSATLHGPKGTSASIDMCYCTLGPSGTPMANQTPYECTQAHVLGIAGSVTGLWTFTDPTCCTSGLSFCNGNCTDLQYDAQNCGQCGHVCPSQNNQTPGCAGGRCTVICNAGYEACSYLTGGNSGTQAWNCCPAPPANGVLLCGANTCGYVCASGYADCSGACVDVSSDAGNCGTCGKACPAGYQCVNKNCTPTPGALTADLYINVGAAGAGNTPCTAKVAWTLTSPGQPTQQPQVAYNGFTTTNVGSGDTEATYCPVVESFTSLAPGTWSLKANWQSGSLTCPGIKIAAGQTATYQLWSDSGQCVNITL